MKKTFFIFFIFIFMFISMPLNVKGAEYKICVYRKNVDEVIQGSLHVSGSNVVFDIYRAGDEGWLPFIFDNKLEKTHTVINGDSVKSWPSGVNSTHGELMDPKFLLTRCPESLCETNRGTKMWLDEGGCTDPTGKFKLIDELTESSLKGLDKILAYKFNGSDDGKVDYGANSVLKNGGCPSNVPIFKLAKSAYGILRIAAPVVLVLFASLDLGKAVIASDEGQIKKAQSHLIKRIAAAVVVFLVFVIIELFVGMVSGGSDAMSCVNQFLN